MTADTMPNAGFATVNPPAPWQYYDPETRLFVNHQSVGRIYEIPPINLPALPDGTLDRLYHDLFHALNAVPHNYVIQFHEVHTTDISPVTTALHAQIDAIDGLPPAERTEAHTYLRAQLTDRIATLHARTEKAAVKPKLIRHYITLYALYPRTMKVSELLMTFKSFPRAMGNSFFSFDPDYPATYSALAADFERNAQDILARLQHTFALAGIPQAPRPLSDSELVRHLAAAFGYPADVPVVPTAELPILEQMGGTFAAYDQTGYRPSPRPEAPHTTTLYLRHYPSRIRMGALAPLAEVQGSFTITTSFFHEPRPQKLFDALQYINVRLTTLGNPKGQAKYHKDQIVRRKVADGNHVFRSATVISFLSDTATEKRLVRAFKNAFQSAELNIPAFHDQDYAPVSYLAGLPFGYNPATAQSIGLNVPILTESVRSILPIYGNHPRYKDGDRATGLQFQTAEGSVSYINLDSLTAPAKHGLVVGFTGSGKSFLLNNILETTINRGGDAFVVDPGRSMEPLIASHGGQFYNISAAEPFRANIFAGDLYPIDPETKQPSQAKYNLLVNFLLIMIYGTEPKENPVQLNVARDIVGKAIQAAYKEIDATANTTGFGTSGAIRTASRQRNVTLSLVSSKIADPSGINDVLVDQLRRSLAQYCQGGQYGIFFDVDHPPLADRLMGINLDKIKGDRVLSALLLILFTTHATSVFEANRAAGRPQLHLLMVDEVHQYLHGSFMGDWIREQFKVLRKFGVAFFVASQSLRDFVSSPGHQNPAGEAVLESTPYWWLMRQDDYTKEFAEDPNRPLAALSKATIERIAQQRMVKGKDGYSPVFLLSRDNPLESGFLRYYATLRELATYSTDPADHRLRTQHYKALQQQGFTGADLWTRAIEATVNDMSREETARQ